MKKQKASAEQDAGQDIEYEQNDGGGKEKFCAEGVASRRGAKAVVVQGAGDQCESKKGEHEGGIGPYPFPVGQQVGIEWVQRKE